MNGFRVQLVVIGDIGPVDGMIHIGDEAMFDEAVHRLRARGVDRIVGISSNPDDTAARYGVDSLLAAGRGGSPEAIAEAVAASDGVLIAGGGNLASIWPGHIVERAALARLAAEHGRPFVVTGQTFGPVLTGEHRETVAGMLRSARLVGSREAASHALVAELGVPGERSALNVDDASFVAGGPLPPSEPYALVTFARHVGDADPDRAATAQAELLDAVAERTGVRIVFHAHFASLDPDEVRGDSAVHAAIADRLRTDRVEVAATTDVAHSAALARAAALVVTSRYHPAVFAGPAGVPTIGIPVDDYTDVKLHGALGAFGQDGVLTMERLIAGDGPAVVERVWRDADVIRQRGLRRADDARVASDAWWDRVRGVFESD